MATTVCLGANTLHYVAGGGHVWAYLNWALGLREAGCDVIWLEESRAKTAASDIAALEERLEHYGLAGCLALTSGRNGCHDLDAAAEADVLLNLWSKLPASVTERFARSAFVDIDPGMLQTWMLQGDIELAPHDVYFSIGENALPDVGIQWEHAPPCVALSAWPKRPAPHGSAAFTTVTHWHGPVWIGDAETGFNSEKRQGFLPFLDLPERVDQPLELALPREEKVASADLRKRGWRVQPSQEVASTPWDYQRYIQASLGEFSCAKPFYTLLQNAWVSDRTLCYLASGRPAVVQHTGPSGYLPDAEGLFRFGTIDEATQALAQVGSDYERQSSAARALAEEHFDARKVVTRILERVLP